MAAYVIVEIETTDQLGMKAYREAAAPTVAVHGGRYLVRGGPVQTLEGGWNPERLAVLGRGGIPRSTASRSCSGERPARRR